MFEPLLEVGMAWLVKTQKLVRDATDKEVEMTGVDPDSPDNMIVVDCVVDFGRLAPLTEVSRNRVYAEAFGPVTTVRCRSGDVWIYCMDYDAFVEAYAAYAERNKENFDRFNYHRGLGGEVSAPLWK